MPRFYLFVYVKRHNKHSQHFTRLWPCCSYYDLQLVVHYDILLKILGYKIFDRELKKANCYDDADRSGFLKRSHKRRSLYKRIRREHLHFRCCL